MDGLPLHVTALVLFAGLLHATWNALLKRPGGEPLLDTALVTAGTWIVAAAALPFVPAPARTSWPFIGLSAAIHFGYYVALARAYGHGDLGYAYPLMRGTAPLLVAGAGTLWLDETPSAIMMTGIALISVGIVGIALLRTGGKPRGPALRWALANAVIIAAYTVVDGAGVRSSGHAASYVLWLLFVESIPFVAAVSWRRRSRVVAHARRFWVQGVLGGLCSAGAYGIALWAMTRAPIGAVAALRETSVVFAALIGAVVLKEPLGAHRIVGALLVVAGIALLKI